MIGLLVGALAIQATTVINCRDPQTQMEINHCAMQAYQRADAEMTRQWKIAVADAKSSDKQSRLSWDKRPGYFSALLDGQRAWLRFRDAHCISAGYRARGGSMEPMLVAICKKELTDARAKQLRDLLKGWGE
jgi:uncharacterized protein YecT (DUF1311 family)